LRPKHLKDNAAHKEASKVAAHAVNAAARGQKPRRNPWV
jgi:hypothetical protein